MYNVYGRKSIFAKQEHKDIISLYGIIYFSYSIGLVAKISNIFSKSA
jgi:hypothetical protein